MLDASHDRSQFAERIHRAFLEGDAGALDKEVERANVQLVQRLFQALSEGDFDAIIAAMHEDIDYEIVAGEHVPFAGKLRGRAAAADRLRGAFALFDQQRPVVRSVVAQGDMVVVIGDETGVIRATNEPYEVHWVHLFTVRDGQVVQFCEYLDSTPWKHDPRGKPL